MPRNPLAELSEFLKFRQDCKVVFESPQGKRVLHYLMKKGCVTTPVASSNSDESLRNQGAQRLVLSILRAVKIDDTIEEQVENEYDS
jgi:hypothetical protein